MYTFTRTKKRYVTLISYARAFERNLVVDAVVSRRDTTSDGYDTNDDKNSDKASSTSLRDDHTQLTEEDDSSQRAVDVDSELSNRTPAMSSTLDTAHTSDNNVRKKISTRMLISFVDYSQCCMFSHKNSHKPAINSADAVKEENTMQNNTPRDETGMTADFRRKSNKHVPIRIYGM